MSCFRSATKIGTGSSFSTTHQISAHVTAIAARKMKRFWAIGRIAPFSRAVFEAYWGDLEDISQDEVLRRVVERVGLDWADVSAKIASDAYKKKLRDNTDELIARGGFGSPTMFVDRDDMYFGNDRLVLVEAALAARRARAAAG